MWKTFVRRLLILIPQIILLSLLLFIMASFMPGDALTGKIDPNTSPARLEELRQQWGYYDPWHVKFTRWASNALRGDFGESTFYKIPVTKLIGEKAGNTFSLSLLTLILTYAIAIPLGIIAGRYNEKWPEKAITAYTYVALAMPTFAFGILNIFLFALKFKIFPVSGSADVTIATGTLQFYIDKLYHMILPSLTGALIYTTGTIQYLRSEIVDYSNSDFVVTAKSKGVPGNVIYSKHIFRNALIPIASSLGYQITGLLSGSIFIENVFAYPGMGQLFMQSIQRRDYAVVNCLVIFYAVLTVLGTLLSDLFITLVDPRIRIK